MEPTMTVEEQIDRLFIELAECRALLISVADYVMNTDRNMNEAKEIISKVSGEVMPTVNALSESPMLKMFLPKKAK